MKMESKTKQLKTIIEEPDAEKANLLAMSNDFCQPKFSEKRNTYIFIRRKKASYEFNKNA